MGANPDILTAVTILLTGFEPFAGAASNPSEELVRRFSSETATEVLPVEFEALGRRVPELLARHRPRHVVCLGLSAGATGLTFERVGINLIDARIPDNSGAQPVDVPVVDSGPAAHFTSLPVKAMMRAVRKVGVPADSSLSAGSYACNALLYLMLHHSSLELAGSRFRAGFIHLPPVEVLSLDAQERGLRAALARVDDQEMHYSEGALD